MTGEKPGEFDHLDTEKPDSLKDLVNSLISMIKALYNLAPAAILVGLILASLLIWVSLQFAEIMMGIIIIIVLGVSLFIYGKTNDYGEASLALVAGLLTAFTVEWTQYLFVLFTVTWVGFSAFAALLQSVKLAAEAEDIYRQAAISIDSTRTKEIEKQLREITKTNTLRTLGPIEEARVMLILAFHKLPLEFNGIHIEINRNAYSGY